MNAFWNKYRHIIIAGVIAAGFIYAAFHVSPLAAGLEAAGIVCSAAALWFFHKES